MVGSRQRNHYNEGMKVATVSVIGRPSAGKSTLVNTITGMKVSITSPTPQTTRNKIRGIYTDSRGQLIFTDTPGFHISEKEINKRMQDVTVSSLKDSDMILYLLDGKRTPGKEEETISRLVAAAEVPVVAVLNKSDILSDEEKKTGTDFLSSCFPSSPVLLASGKNDEGVDEILIELFRIAPEGEMLYDESTYTDQDLEFRVSEIIREKTIENLSDEMPHVIFVEIEDMEYDEKEAHVWIRAAINTEREGQKGIIVGRGGENIKRIRKESFKEIRRIFPGSRLTLDLRVKSQPGWRKNGRTLDRIFRD